MCISQLKKRDEVKTKLYPKPKGQDRAPPAGRECELPFGSSAQIFRAADVLLAALSVHLHVPPGPVHEEGAEPSGAGFPPAVPF